MNEYINVGADVHDKTILVKLARGLEQPEKRCFRNDPPGRARMIGEFRERSERAGGAEVVRARLDAGEKSAKIKTQIRCLFKR